MEKEAIVFHSAQSRVERIAAICWLPVHLFLLPLALGLLFPAMDAADLNFAVYSVGAAYMLFTQRRFLRRDFDPLCDRPGNVLIQVCVCYGVMLLFNLAVSGLLALLLESMGESVSNPNNSAIVDLAQGRQYGKVSALAIFLAPIVEELIFRAGVFGALRPVNRVLAYAVSIALFSVYHVWGYAVGDPVTWIYVLQYLPVSYLLCRCYERSDSIWGSIFFHMLVNAISLRALTMLQELL